MREGPQFSTRPYGADQRGQLNARNGLFVHEPPARGSLELSASQEVPRGAPADRSLSLREPLAARCFAVHAGGSPVGPPAGSSGSCNAAAHRVAAHAAAKRVTISVGSRDVSASRSSFVTYLALLHFSLHAGREDLSWHCTLHLKVFCGLRIERFLDLRGS